MAGPITWQNVRATAGEPADAARPLAGAQQSFNGVFDTLSGILNQRLAMEQSNQGAIREANTQNYLDQVNGLKTPEALAAAAPTLEQARAALSPADRARTRAAEEARLTSIRQNVVAGQAYDAGQRETAALPVRDAAAAKAATGDTQGAIDLAMTLPDGAGRAALLSSIETARRTRMTNTQADALAALKNPNDLDAERLRTQLFPTTSATAAKKATLDATQVDLQTTDAATQVLDRQLEERLAVATGARQTSLSTTRAAIEDVARGFPGVPRNTDGSLAVNRLSPDQRLSLNDVLDIKKIPRVETLEGGDTQAIAQFNESLRKAGIKPTSITKLQPQVAAAFNTAALGPSGNDLANQERDLRVQDVTTRMNTAMFTPMTTPGASETAMDAAKAEVDKIHPVGSYRNQNWNEAIANMKGIVAKDANGKPITGADGTPIRVLPGPAAMKQILRGTENSFFGFGKGDIQDAIKAWENDAVNQKGAAAAINDSLLNAFRGVDIPKPAQTK